MKIKPNLNVQIYGANTLMMHLTALVQEINGVRLAEDIEAVHRMRVASRRLRATIPMFGQAVAGKRHLVWIRNVRGITRALGEARDSDVQIASIQAFLDTLQSPYRSGVRRLLLRLKQRRSALQPRVMKELDKFEKSGLVGEIAQKLAPFTIYRDQLNSNDPELLGLADREIHNRLGDFLGYDDIVNQPEKVQELHAMRISAKHLRYTLETFAPLFEDGLRNYLKMMRSAQDMLGEIHDCDVWAIQMPEFIQEENQRTLEYFGTPRPFKRLVPGLILYQEARHSEREATYTAFRDAWIKWKTEGRWSELSELLKSRLSPVIIPPVEEELSPEWEIPAGDTPPEVAGDQVTPADPAGI